MPPNSQDFLSRSCASGEGFRLRHRRDLGSHRLTVPATLASFSVHAVPTLITLCDGSPLDIKDPDYTAVSTRNIVHGLSGVYRFAGQSPRRLTVAEHTLMGARQRAHPEVAAAVARAGSLNRLLAALSDSGPATCEALSRAFLIHDAPECVLHDLTSALKGLPELVGYKRVERMHMERVAAALNVPYVCLGGQTAAAYAEGYKAAWVNTRDRQRLYPRASISELAIPSLAEQEAHLLTAEVWAAVKMIDSALGAIELEVAWEIGGPSQHCLFDLAIAAVDYAFLVPDHASIALMAALPREWRDPRP